MSNAIDFQSDAMECLRMAERAERPEEKSVLVGLARAWIALSEQFKYLHDANPSDFTAPPRVFN